MMYELKEMDKKKEGIEEGIKIGEARGEARGKAIGEAKATERMAKLITVLMQDGKTEDVLRICSDETYRNAKMKEYGLM